MHGHDFIEKLNANLQCVSNITMDNKFPHEFLVRLMQQVINCP